MKMRIWNRNKQGVSFLLALILLLLQVPFAVSAAPNPEVRGVWISFLEFQTMLTGKTEAEFRKNITQTMDNIKDYGLNTVYVQVRPYSDALYRSDYFPWSHIVTGVEGKDPGFDPLQIMVEAAHTNDLKIEAWVNPYRVRPAGNTKPLASNSPAAKWLKVGDRAVVKQGDMISYNPASPKARGLIVSGIQEIVRKYDVDGIHIDDYFYPHTGTSFDNTFDLKEYRAYQAKGGALSHADWRRANVETLLKAIYKAVKAEDPKVLFGISPQSSIQNNYTQQYLNVEKIAANNGYCDYIAPQIYFGFQNDTQPFAKTLDEWNKMTKTSNVKLYVGVATYKIGVYDSYAGAGSGEWVASDSMMADMIDYARGQSEYAGFVLYRYDHMFRPETAVKKQTEAERRHLLEIL